MILKALGIGTISLVASESSRGTGWKSVIRVEKIRDKSKRIVRKKKREIRYRIIRKERKRDKQKKRKRLRNDKRKLEKS